MTKKVIITILIILSIILLVVLVKYVINKQVENRTLETLKMKKTDIENRSGVFIDPRDNKEYKTIQIGDQTWFAENLGYMPFLSSPNKKYKEIKVKGYDGDNVAKAKQTANYQALGCMYNYKMAETACPEGWHLPSKEEWDNLVETNLPMELFIEDTTRFEIEYWGLKKNYLNINKTGFSAIPSGFYSNIEDRNTSWWTSTYSGVSGGFEPCHHAIKISYKPSNNFYSIRYFDCGFASSEILVRCVKD